MSEKQTDRLEATHLPVTIAGIDFHNPFCVGSGPTVKTVDMIRKIDAAGWGAAFIKLTIDPEPYMTREPRYRWWKQHKLHTFTLEKRIKLDEALRICEESKKFISTTKIFSNITYDGEDGLDGWVRMAKAFENAGADGNELNMCCPNMSFNMELSGDEIDKCTGASMGRNPLMVAEVVRAVKAGSKIPLFVKITSEGGNIALVARAAYDAGADVVASVGDRLGMPPIADIENPLQSPIRLQKDQSITDLTGPWLKPLALRDVYEIRKLNGPERAVCGYGGMSNWKDYVEMMLVGADLVGVCTETMIRGYDFLYKEIIKFKDYMIRHNYKHPREMRDLIVNNIKPAQAIEIQEAVAFVEEQKCIGCQLCLPIGHCYAIDMIKGKGWEEKNKKGIVAKVDPYQCTGCSTCFDLCPTDCFIWKAVPEDRIIAPI
jgi:dihydroorotate dehydrogenase/NAD-dependent dihydropyrimidine dehydrogenase PreA subunit